MVKRSWRISCIFMTARGPSQLLGKRRARKTHHATRDSRFEAEKFLSFLLRLRTARRRGSRRENVPGGGFRSTGLMHDSRADTARASAAVDRAPGAARSHDASRARRTSRFARRVTFLRVPEVPIKVATRFEAGKRSARARARARAICRDRMAQHALAHGGARRVGACERHTRLADAGPRVPRRRARARRLKTLASKRGVFPIWAVTRRSRETERAREIARGVGLP